jgi:hypothetical protein
MNWREHLQARLLEMQPANVYALDESAYSLASSVLQTTPIHPYDRRPDAPCALALGIDALNGLSTRQAGHLINQTRLYVAPRILLAVRQDCALSEESFRALGFVLSATDTLEKTHIYYYDLDTYKTVPDWLNARFWAHPERWKP